MQWKKIFGVGRDPRSYGEYVKKAAPDRRHMMVFDPGLEVRMMCCEHGFRLIDARAAVTETFQGLASPMQEAWWSPNSRIVAVPVLERTDCLLLFDLSRRRYSVILFSSYQQKAKVTCRGVRIGVDPGQFREVFGEGFRPPDDTVFPFSSLRWMDAPDKTPWNLGPALRGAPRALWRPPPSREMRAYARKQGISLCGIRS